MATSGGSSSPDELLDGELDGIIDDSYPLEPFEEGCEGCESVTPHEVYLPSFNIESERGNNSKNFTYRLSICNECGESCYDEVRDLE